MSKLSSDTPSKRSEVGPVPKEAAVKGFMASARSLAGPASIYVVANIINAAVPFALMPVLTRHLTPTEYGIVAMFQVLTGFVGPFVGMNVHGAIHRRYYDQEATDVPTYVGNGLLILVGSASTVGLALFALGPWLSELTSLPASWMWAVLVTALGQFLVHVRLVIWQAQVRPVLYGVYQLFQTIANLGLSVWLVAGLGWGWEGRVVGLTTSYAVFGLLAVGLLVAGGWVRFKPRRDYIENALRFGVPLIPHTFAAYAITATDKLFITSLVSVSETGVYLVAVQVATILGLLITSVNKAWTPWLYARLREGGGSEQRVVQTIYLAIPLMIGGALLLSLVAPYFLEVYVGESFVRAGQFVFWLAIGQAFNGAYLVVANLIFYAEKTHFLAWTTLATAALNIGLNYPMTLYLGANGAAMATAAAFFLKFVLTAWLVTLLVSMPWKGTFNTLLRRQAPVG